MQTQTPQCHIERRAEGVVAITFDNGRLNLLTSEAAAIYTATLRDLARDDSIRLLIVQGGAAAFLGGADIKFLKDAGKADIDAYIRGVYALCEQLRDLPFPTMSIISGYCLGAGMEVAAVCDIKVASGDAKFGMPEVKLGVPSVIHGAMLPGMIGWTRTRDLLLSGRMIGAQQACDWGLISDVAGEGGLAQCAAAWQKELLEGGPHAMRIQKKLIRDWERLPLAEAISIGIDALVSAYETDEPKRYMEAFLLHRKRA
ncbi:enoyl-CoA hydratase-related protein [Achromobacter seleniivolatilans]|uniref:Enoyl-CoA hydratase-related protein n=1 Tax=Achromobacter seleniivolatilans TaxID=3047478 RepID=A0ABY9LW98_9BURK|nr:enoyl-CoA hydratase-related protein [Achromobacter sp. R39]WMD18633.1 enoyl-CoA hydratase-related protein [Achromobacter sp. R39]